jgi:tRNA (guanine-N7-)-methyltransferase
LRQGRISPAQQKAYAALLPQFGIPFAPELLDLAATFGRHNPKILEIGFGMGETTAAIAQAQPARDFLAIDVHTPGVGSLLKLIEEHGLTNIRVLQHDAVEVVDSMIAPGALAGIHIFFPDPWPKKRHHKRRLLRPEFVRQLGERIEPGGYLHAATDWEEYAREMLAALCAEPLFENTAREFAPRPSPCNQIRAPRTAAGSWRLGPAVPPAAVTRYKLGRCSADAAKAGRLCHHCVGCSAS